MKKRIVIIGAGCFQVALIKKANEMGLETHVFAWEEGAEGKDAADYFYPISIIEKEKILEFCKKIHPHAVATIASELANITVQYLAEKLELPRNSASCIENTTNKAKMRSKLKECGVACCPEFLILNEEEAATYRPCMSYPLIVKPTDRSGSRGVRRVDNEQQLKEAILDALSYSFEKKVILEQWIEGDEFSCECISKNGQHYCLALTKKYTTGSPLFVETGHLQPAYLKGQDAIIKEVFQILDVLEIENGASHTEFRIDEHGKFWLMETGSRMGGDCIGSDLVPLSTGIDYVKACIQIALGEEPDLESREKPCTAAIKFILNNDDNVVKELVQRDPDFQIINESQVEMKFGPVMDSSTRSGYFIFIGSDDTKVRAFANQHFE